MKRGDIVVSKLSGSPRPLC